MRWAKIFQVTEQDALIGGCLAIDRSVCILLSLLHVCCRNDGGLLAITYNPATLVHNVTSTSNLSPRRFHSLARELRTTVHHTSTTFIRADAWHNDTSNIIADSSILLVRHCVPLNLYYARASSISTTICGCSDHCGLWTLLWMSYPELRSQHHRSDVA